LIRGDINKIIDIVNNFIRPNYIEKIRIINLLKSYNIHQMYGIYLSYNVLASQLYGTVVLWDENHFKTITHLKNWGYKFMGELKMVDGELILDDLLVDTEKYNL
jgi:hypothetical protein